MSENEPSCPSPSSTLPSLYKADPLKRRRQQQRSRTRKHTRKNSLQHAGEIVRARGLLWKDTHAGPQWVCAKVPGENEDLSVNTSPLEQVGARPKRDHDSQRSDATDGGWGLNAPRRWGWTWWMCGGYETQTQRAREGGAREGGHIGEGGGVREEGGEGLDA
jgi:hypothetical protein